LDILEFIQTKYNGQAIEVTTILKMIQRGVSLHISKNYDRKTIKKEWDTLEEELERESKT